MSNIIKNIIAQSRILKLVRKQSQPQIFIFNYHRIFDNKKPVHFDDGVFGPSTERFEQEMKWILNETRVISEKELIDIVYSKTPIHEICSMVTFDDGYRDNYELAFPILKSLKIPAIFFIPTWHINERKLGWWDIVSYLVKNSKKDTFQFLDKEFQKNDSLTLPQIITTMKLLKETEIDKLVLTLSVILNVDIPDVSLQSEELMTWDQIKLMSENGMHFGSHSHKHHILTLQTEDELRENLKQSKDILESYLKKKIETIAYPVGSYSDFNENSKKIVQDVGFKIGFSYLTGVNEVGKIDPFDVKRIGIQPQWKNLDYVLAFPNRAFPEGSRCE